MTVIVQKGDALVGIAKQAAKGTPAAHAWYAHALSSGKPITVDISQDADAITAGQRTRAAGIRTGVAPSLGPLTTHAYMRALGLYLLGVYGNVVDAGTSGAYTHTYSTGDTLPYLTAFSLLDQEYQQVSDIKIGNLGLAWDGPGPVALSVDGAGCAVNAKLGAAWTLPSGGNNETGSEAFLIPTGGTFKVAATGDTPATALITGGEITIGNELDAIPTSASLLPGDQGEKMQNFAATLKVVPEDLALWRTILTGSPTGTAPQETPAYGSFEVDFTEHGVGTGTLALRAHKVAFLCDFPDIDPAGGYVELDLAGVCFYDGTNCPIVAVLTNAVQYYGSGAPGS